MSLLEIEAPIPRMDLADPCRRFPRAAEGRLSRPLAVGHVGAWLLMCLLMLECPSVSSRAAGGAWHELTPLPESRRFHRAVVVDGRLFLLGGRGGLHGNVRAGAHGFSWYEPEQQRWIAGPNVEVGKVVNRTTRVSYRGGQRSESPHEILSGGAIFYEAPPVAAPPEGPIYWLGEPTPAIFHPARGERGEWETPHTVFAPKERRWISAVPQVVRRYGVAAVGPDGRIYHLGGIGYPLIQQERPVPPKPLYTLFDSMDIYDPDTHAWETRAPMRRSRQLFAAVFAPNGMLYVFGGYGHVGSVRQAPKESDFSYERRVLLMKRLGREVLTDVEAYDPATDTWMRRTSLPKPRHAFGAALGADGRIYLVGGASSYSRPEGTADVQIYDPRSDTWEEGPPLLQPRFHHTVASGSDGRIWVTGGFVGGSGRHEPTPTASVEVLDTAPAGE